MSVWFRVVDKPYDISDFGKDKEYKVTWLTNCKECIEKRNPKLIVYKVDIDDEKLRFLKTTDSSVFEQITRRYTDYMNNGYNSMIYDKGKISILMLFDNKPIIGFEKIED